jgi:hypothetical protein
MEPVCNLLGNQGGVAAGAVVDEEVDLDLVLKLIAPSDRKSCSKAQSLPPLLGITERFIWHPRFI